MTDFGFKFIPKELFFDRKKVTDAVERGKRLALSKAGSFVRTRARSITGKPSTKSSDPGRPPKRHVGLLHDLIYFAYSPENSAVDIGPVFLNSTIGKGEAPHALEFSGDVTIKSHGRRRRAHIRARPFMGPSLQAEVAAGTIASSWANCVRG